MSLKKGGQGGCSVGNTLGEPGWHGISREGNRSHADFQAEGVRLRFAATVEMDGTRRVIA